MEKRHTGQRENKHTAQNITKHSVQKKKGYIGQKGDNHAAAYHASSQPRHYGHKFCPKCGRRIGHDQEFCSSCTGVDFKFKNINITVCNNCSSYLRKNKWSRFTDINQAIEKIAMDSIKSSASISRLDDTLSSELKSYKAGVHKDFTIEADVEGQRFELPATIDVTLCPNCAKAGTKYFEAILQIRNSRDEINEFIRKEIALQKKKGVHLNKEESVDGSDENIDFYVTNQTYIKSLAEKLRKSFGGTIKKNAKHFSVNWQTSKTIYRLNLLITFPRYAKNDVIKIGKELFRISRTDKKIHVENIKTGKSTSMPHSESYDIIKPVTAMVIKIYPECEILEPTTYYQAILMNPTDRLQVNQKIRVIINGIEAWMVKE